MSALTTTTPVEIPTKPKSGEIWFYLDLAMIDDVAEAYTLVKALGFQPRIAFRRAIASHQESPDIEVCLLLYHGVVPGMVTPPNDLFEREQMILSDAINPEAMHFVCGLARVVA